MDAHEWYGDKAAYSGVWGYQGERRCYQWWSLVLQGDDDDATIGEASMLPVVVTIPIFVP
jgi:hypothetical protein